MWEREEIEALGLQIEMKWRSRQKPREREYFGTPLNGFIDV